MKLFFMAFVFLLIIGDAKAQSALPGYYITQNNDTVKAQIKVKKGFFGQKTNDFNEEVEVVDDAKGTIKFLPADIHGYGFFADGKQYAFVSKPIKDGKKSSYRPFIQVLNQAFICMASKLPVAHFRLSKYFIPSKNQTKLFCF